MQVETTVLGVRVGYEDFILTHSKAPAGYGTWAFYFGNENEPHFYNGLFSQVKKIAAREAKSCGFYNIKVGS